MRLMIAADLVGLGIGDDDECYALFDVLDQVWRATRPVKAAPRPVTPIRVQILKQAIALTTGDRDQAYGDPLDNLSCQADLWNAYLRHRHGFDGLTAMDVTVMMALMKTARLAVNQDHTDSYVDGSCYMAIAGEIQARS